MNIYIIYTYRYVYIYMYICFPVELPVRTLFPADDGSVVRPRIAIRTDGVYHFLRAWSPDVFVTSVSFSRDDGRATARG